MSVYDGVSVIEWDGYGDFWGGNIYEIMFYYIDCCYFRFYGGVLVSIKYWC